MNTRGVMFNLALKGLIFTEKIEEITGIGLVFNLTVR